LCRARPSAGAGTLQYTPEVRRETRMDARRPYALQVTSWEVPSGKVPFGGVPDAALRETVKSGDRPEIPDGWPDGAVAALVRRRVAGTEHRSRLRPNDVSLGRRCFPLRIAGDVNSRMGAHVLNGAPLKAFDLSKASAVQSRRKMNIIIQSVRCVP